MSWKRIDLSPPWRQDPQLWTDLLSPDGLWHLSIFGYDEYSRRDFQAYLEHSDLYYKLLSDEIDRELAKLEQVVGLRSDPKNISARSRKDAIGKSIVWANQEISKFDDKVFTSKFDSAGRFRLNLLVEKGDREAQSYIKSYFEKLEDRLTRGTKPEKHKALNSIIFILGRYPNWRPLLPDNLHAVADELEDRGILITDVDIDPEALSSIRKSNPKSSPSAGRPRAPARGNMITERQFWDQVEALNWPKKRLNKIDFDHERELLLKKKPIEYWEKFNNILIKKRESLIKKTGSTLWTDSLWYFSVDVIGHGRKMYDRMMSDPDYFQKVLNSEKYGIANFQYMIPTKPLRKKSKSENSSWKMLIGKCRSLWEKYCKSPTKKNLKAIFDHLEAMKSSKSEKVKEERARCLRVANKEAKRLGLKRNP